MLFTNSFQSNNVSRLATLSEQALDKMRQKRARLSLNEDGEYYQQPADDLAEEGLEVDEE